MRPVGSPFCLADGGRPWGRVPGRLSTVQAPEGCSCRVTGPPCSSGRGSLGSVAISAGEEGREGIHHSSRPKPCLGFEYTHQGLSEK